MGKINPFIENLRKTYQESIKLMDDSTYELIRNDANMAAIREFGEIRSDIHEVYETSKNLYSIIYLSIDMLEVFESSKINMNYLNVK